MDKKEKPVMKRVRGPGEAERLEFEEACVVMKQVVKILPGSLLRAHSLVTYHVTQHLKKALTADNMRSSK